MDIDKELEDLFDDPLLDLSEQEAGLFDFPEEMKRVMATKRVQPDYYAQKKPCEDFELYRGMFQQVQKELKEGKRSLIRSTKTSSIDAGFFYVVNGILVYLAEVKDTKKNRNGMVDGRTRCIYENGTESDILLQTLRANIVSVRNTTACSSWWMPRASICVKRWRFRCRRGILSARFMKPF